ncbi:MAG: heme/hemin ABC transporter substrate-binding protein [Hyphomicrobium sp.]
MAVCAALTMSVPALSPSSSAAAQDASQQLIEIPIAAQTRILSLGGDVTEILDALGFMDRIVAVDSTSKYPESALKTKANVGYLRALSTEGALSVNPSAIIAAADAGPPGVVAALKDANIPYLQIKETPNAEGVPSKVRTIGRALGAEDTAESLALKIEADFKTLDGDRALVKQRKRAIVVLAVQNGRAIVAGGASSGDAILTLAGAENAASGMQGFKPVSDEQLAEFAPEAIVVLRRVGEDRDRTIDQVLALSGLRLSPAVQSKSIIEMDGLYLLGFGPRTPSAARELMKALYLDMRADSEGPTP